MEIRLADPSDIGDLGRLLWSHAGRHEQAVQPVESFTAELASWWEVHSDSHVAFVAGDGHAVVGMAWLALVTRPPRPGAPERRSADIQSVYVEPNERGRGVGAALVRAATQHAWSHEAERVSVHSSTKAVPMYERLGFSSARELLQTARPAQTSSIQ